MAKVKKDRPKSTWRRTVIDEAETRGKEYQITTFCECTIRSTVWGKGEMMVIALNFSSKTM